MRRLLLLLAFCLQVSGQDMALRPFEKEGFAAMQGGDFERCAAIFTGAAKDRNAGPSPAFVAARCHARAGDTASARQQLSSALDRGYRNCASLRREEALASFEDLALRCEANAEQFVA